MNAIILRAIAAEYLRYERQCPIVAFERSHWPATVYPDVLGVTKKQHVVEIEIKCSMSDFRTNSKKRSESFRKAGLYVPHQYYFFVPPNLVSKVKNELPEHAGLMSTIESLSVWSKLPKLTIWVPAKVNKQAQKLDIRDIVKLVAAQSGTVCSLARDVARQHYQPEICLS